MISITIINNLIGWLSVALQSILQLLPNSPFMYVYNLDAEWLNIINYFLPITEFVGCLEAYTVGVLTYYVIRVPLRWAKAAGE